MIEQAAILCGGLGTRLGALTARTPKPLLPVAGRPFLDLLLFQLGGRGVRRVVLLAGFASAEIARYAAETPVKDRFGLKIQVSIEPQPAGTGGGVWHARELLDDAFFLLNGDSWFDIDILRLSAALFAAPAAAAVLAVRQLTDAARYGVVETADRDPWPYNRASRIMRFAERPGAHGPGLVSGGVYACRRRLLSNLAPACSLEKDAFPALCAAGHLLALLLDGYFIDIGVPESLSQAQRDIGAAWNKLERRALAPGVGPRR